MSEMDEEVTRGWLNEAPANSDTKDTSDSIYRRKVFVGFFKKKFNEEQLRDYFQRFGSIEKIVIPRDGFGASRGCAFITFSDEKSADNVFITKPHTLLGTHLDLRHAFPKDFYSLITTNHQSREKIFIGGLPKGITKDEIGKYFESCYGHSPLFGIEEIVIPIDSTGKSKGFAFVKFKNEDIVDRIIYEKNRADICGRQCEIKRAEMREEDIKIENQKKLLSSTTIENNHISLMSTDRNSKLKLVSLGVEKLKKLANNSNVPSINDVNTIEQSAPYGKSLPTLINGPNSKRSLQGRISLENGDLFSDKFDNETLAKVGRIFVDTISNAVQNDPTLNSPNSMSYLFIEALKQIIMNVKKD